jgi:hypothetical protein
LTRSPQHGPFNIDPLYQQSPGRGIFAGVILIALNARCRCKYVITTAGSSPAIQASTMGKIIKFKNPSLKKKAEGKKLCKRGFHRWAEKNKHNLLNI